MSIIADTIAGKTTDSGEWIFPPEKAAEFSKLKNTFFSIQRN